MTAYPSESTGETGLRSDDLVIPAGVPDDTDPTGALTGPATLPLDAFHRAHGGKMVDFAGYALPVQYGAGVMAEHLHCRSRAVLFDVSHMGQALLHGTDAAAELEKLVPSDILGLKDGRQRYSVLLNEAGGIIDDLMIARLSADRMFLVVNAARKAVDYRHLETALPGSVRLEPMFDRALLALQGPGAAAVLDRLGVATSEIPFMGLAEALVGGIPVQLTRGGYTGEDGFELSVASDRAETLAETLIADPEVLLAGLGARDSLRLEAGLCLYGNDIDEVTTPVEASLNWVIGKRRREDFAFEGGVVVRDQLAHGAPRLRVGLRPEGRAPARAGTTIVAADGTEAGIVTSGTFGPSVEGGAPVSMGYLRRDLIEAGDISLLVRNRAIAARRASLPFVKHRYFSAKSAKA
ncbi:aminomethyltransferase [Endobacter medicaginis]|uniref:aminomethyltransferase n=1 Tax=Endobacter medicaginis TaxID=1181271 RepID=A0A850NP68_9PROT|nr:glycine cleavage system aminomethyltransferase GcvT [Endobacter medicaginis]MBB3174680.1 aminomethyltransferase [Endobacter medicaginis]MCX5474925.1 glycine cleavage system aminomethyltransferase GcvT [Endobacter medicaginis]NVN28935.1 glycine cleavage system aminomethyltransferase GcvT [Endobacter medicaginis]